MGTLAVAAVPAGTNTASVAQALGLIATGTYAATDVVTLSIGSFIKDITVGTIATAAQAGRAELMAKVKAEIEAILGDAVTVSAVGVDAGTSAAELLQTAITITSKAAGTALPSFSIANKTVDSSTTGKVTSAATTVASQGTDAAAVTVTANVVATGANAAKEVKQIVISDGTTPAAEIGSYKVTIGTTVYEGAAAAPGNETATTPATIAADLVRIINAAMGSTVAVQGTDTAGASNGTIVITAPTAGTPLPLVSVDYVHTGTTSTTMVKPDEAFSTLVANVTANSAGVAATAAVGYAATAFTTVDASVAGDINTTLGATATAKLTTSAGAATVAGGADVTVTATKAVTLSGAALTTVKATTGTTSAAINIGASGSTETTVAPKLVSATVKGGSDVLVTDYSKGVSSGTLTSVTVGGTKDTAVTLQGKALTNLTVLSQSSATDITIDSTGATADHTLNLTLDAAGTISATAPVVVEITDNSADVIAINAVKSSNVKLDGDSGLTLVTAQGAGPLTVNLDGANNGIKTFDGSAATGAITITNLSSATKTVKTGAGADTLTTTSTAAFVLETGAGNDVVTIGAAVAAGTTIGLGADNDILLKGSSGSVAVDTAGEVTKIDGGSGNNVLSSDLITAGNADQFVNFNTLGLANTGTFDSTLVSGISSLHLLVLGGTYTGVTPAMSLAIDKNSATGSGATTLTFATGTATGANDSYTIGINNVTTSTTATSASPTGVDNGTIAAAGIENFLVTSNATGFVNNTIDLTSAQLKTVVLTGSATATTLGFGTSGTNVTTGNAGGAVNLIDASGYSGRLSLNTTNVTADNQTGVGLTIKSGSNNDAITLTTSATVYSGAGDDTIVTSGSDAVTVMYGGAGNNTFDVALSVGAAGGAVIMDLKSLDKIDVAGTFTAGALGAKVNVDAATSLAAALDIANGTSVTTSPAAQLVWFQYGGSTYLYADLVSSATTPAQGTVDGNDNIVKITGLVNLEGSTFTTAGVVTII